MDLLDLKFYSAKALFIYLTFSESDEFNGGKM